MKRNLIKVFYCILFILGIFVFFKFNIFQSDKADAVLDSTGQENVQSKNESTSVIKEKVEPKKESTSIKSEKVGAKKEVTPQETTIPSSKQLDVPLLNQMDAPRLYNGCEVTSLAMILNFYHINVSKNELASNLKSVPLTYENGLKGNPHVGFVGDVTGANPGLGVYHEPIVGLASNYINNNKIHDISGEAFDEVIKAVAEGKPVWVITTSTFAPVNNIQTWNTPSGKVDISFSEHSVVVTGYDEHYIYINNPYGQKNQRVDKENFIKAWKQMGKQAVYFEK